MGQKSRYVLPAVVNPSTSTCYAVPVPDDPQHLAAFMGAIYGLSKPYEWQNDPAHTAIDVGAVWREIFDNLEVCMPVEFRQFDDCTLQASFDGGSTWSTIFQADACVAQGILDAIDSGTVSPGGQQAPGGNPTPGQCYSYNVKLDGNGRWKAPIPVVANDTITVTQAQGGWYDGDAFPIGFWNCPSGDQYQLGDCASGSGTTQPTDPEPTINHMRLIGNIASEAAPFFDMYNLTYTVTAATATDAEFYLQANDSTLGDNQGSITLKVEICRGLACDTYDWKVSTQGFVVLPIRPYGTWSGGVGWSAQTNHVGNYSIYLTKPIVNHSFIKSIRVKGVGDGDNLGFGLQVSADSDGASINTPTGPFDHTFDCNWIVEASEGFVVIIGDGTIGSGIKLEEIEFCYSGLSPF